MIKINIKPFLWASVIVVVISYYIISTWFSNGLFSDISKTVTIIALIWFLYVKWLWRFCIYIKLLPYPYLGYQWEGKLHSTYEGGVTVKIKVTIKHRLFNSSICLETDESKSISNSFTFDIDEERGLNRIIYTYHNVPNAIARKHSEIHFGTAMLSIKDKGQILEGNYWTDRGTTGTIILHRI